MYGSSSAKQMPHKQNRMHLEDINEKGKQLANNWEFNISPDTGKKLRDIITACSLSALKRYPLDRGGNLLKENFL